jgi:hypothetical protein
MFELKIEPTFVTSIHILWKLHHAHFVSLSLFSCFVFGLKTKPTFEHCEEKHLELFPIQKDFTCPMLSQTLVVSQKPHSDPMQIDETRFKTLAKKRNNDNL